MKNLLVLAAVILVCILIISGCSNPATTTTPTITITPTIPSTQTPSTTAPAKTTPPATAPTVTSSATPISPVATANPNAGGTLRWIEAVAPGVPIGSPTEGGANSVFDAQVCLQTPIKEQIGGKLVPNVVESWDLNTDPATPSATFHLRKGVKFSDGTDFNAQALKWNFDQIKAAGNNPATTANWKTIDVIDDYTLRVTFAIWQNRIIRSFADSGCFFISPTAYQKNGLDYIRYHMVGTGPFIQTDYQKDVSLTVAKNPNYWDTGKPLLDNIQILYVADEMTRVALFKSGGAEVLNCNYSGRVAAQFQTQGYNIITQPRGASILVPDSSNADSPWSNLKVRQAADYAIDKQAIAKALGYGYWQAAYQICSPASMAYDSNLTGRVYDPVKAKQLLTDAGYPNGFKTRIIGETGSNDAVVAIQANLAKIGIQADLLFPDPGLVNQYLTSPYDNALVFNTLIEWGNPNVAFNFFFGLNPTFYKSLAKPDGWKDILTPSLTTPAPDPTATKKVEDVAYDFALVIPVYYGSSLWVTKNNVKDSGIGQRGGDLYWEPQNAWLAK